MDTPTADTPTASTPDYQPPVLTGGWTHRRKPKAVVKRDLLPAVGVLGALAVCGVALAFAWSRLAPGELVQVVDGNQLAPLRAESYHRYDDLVLFVLMTLGAGLVSGSAVWALRERRGPVFLVALVLGSALAAWLATRVGPAWADAHYAAASAPQVGDVLTLAPRLESPWLWVAWPFAAALTYTFAAAWNGLDDLGRRLG
ncbi:hypothetical protein BJP25_10545 [Actinokineospora bangkokensis]|uniref:DUF2567 domain-containing protein n=1 Tax=Actinokineospora bangkokensis TaxID=1193682 RepID=A0A1Q9LQB8_9PSEU|nr:hypothetical protein BJP25_10545 [Actinokineospora bangkokensis]